MTYDKDYYNAEADAEQHRARNATTQGAKAVHAYLAQQYREIAKSAKRRPRVKIKPLAPAVCRHEHWHSGWYLKQATRLGYSVSDDANPESFHRKTWEFAAIMQTLEQRKLLKKDKKGLGFAVGQEPLPAVMASLGVEVLATDLMTDRVNENWKSTGQHAAGLDALYHQGLVNRDEFERLVRFEPADMTDLATLSGEFDFLWSSCAFEHLGTIDRGLDFVVNAMRLLKPGGVAVHTTEFNVSSVTDTITEGPDVIYRASDMARLGARLNAIGCRLEPIDYNTGSHPFDLHYDTQPYYQSGCAHIKLEFSGFVCTSMLVVAVKG